MLRPARLRRSRSLFVFVLVLALAGAASGCVKARGPDPARVAPRRDVVLSVSAEIADVPEGAKELRMWIPVPRDEGAQVLHRVTPEGRVDTRIVRDERLGNTAMLVVVKEPARSVSAGASFAVSRAEQRGPGRAHPLANPDKQGADPKDWLADERLTFVSDEIREISRSIHREGMTHAEKARAAYDYVLANMRYSKEGTGWGAGSVVWACDRKYGNCTDFHALFIALMRAGGVPSRFRIGFSLPAERGAGAVAGYHCWAEWYDEAKGWTPVDISEAWKQAAKREYFFGNLDHDRVGVSLGRDLVFEGQKGEPLNYFVFPYAEVDGEPIKVSTTVRYADVVK